MTTTFRLIAVGCILYILVTSGHDRTPVFRQPATECPSTGVSR